MATDLSFIEYCIEQLNGLINISYKKMFGEYMIYVSSKPVLLVCDNTVFMKKHTFLDSLNLETGFPYNGAKEHYILDPDDRERLVSAATEAEKITPLPKKKVKKIKE